MAGRGRGRGAAAAAAVAPSNSAAAGSAPNAAYYANGGTLHHNNYENKKIDEVIRMIESLKIDEDIVRGAAVKVKEICRNEEILKSTIAAIHSKSLYEPGFGRKAANLFGRLSQLEVASLKFRDVLLRLIQSDYNNRDYYHERDFTRFLNSITLLCRIFGGVELADGTPIRILVIPIIDYFTMILRQPTEEGLAVVTHQLQILGPVMEQCEPEAMRKLGFLLRRVLLKQPFSPMTTASILLVLELSILGWPGVLPHCVEEFYSEVLPPGSRLQSMEVISAVKIAEEQQQRVLQEQQQRLQQRQQQREYLLQQQQKVQSQFQQQYHQPQLPQQQKQQQQLEPSSRHPQILEVPEPTLDDLNLLGEACARLQERPLETDNTYSAAAPPPPQQQQWAQVDFSKPPPGPQQQKQPINASNYYSNGPPPSGEHYKSPPDHHRPPPAVEEAEAAARIAFENRTSTPLTPTAPTGACFRSNQLNLVGYQEYNAQPARPSSSSTGPPPPVDNWRQWPNVKQPPSASSDLAHAIRPPNNRRSPSSSEEENHKSRDRRLRSLKLGPGSVTTDSEEVTRRKLELWKRGEGPYVEPLDIGDWSSTDIDVNNHFNKTHPPSKTYPQPKEWTFHSETAFGTGEWSKVQKAAGSYDKGSSKWEDAEEEDSGKNNWNKDETKHPWGDPEESNSNHWNPKNQNSNYVQNSTSDENNWASQESKTEPVESKSSMKEAAESKKDSSSYQDEANKGYPQNCEEQSSNKCSSQNWDGGSENSSHNRSSSRNWDAGSEKSSGDKSESEKSSSPGNSRSSHRSDNCSSEEPPKSSSNWDGDSEATTQNSGNSENPPSGNSHSKSWEEVKANEKPSPELNNWHDLPSTGITNNLEQSKDPKHEDIITAMKQSSEIIPDKGSKSNENSCCNNEAKP